MEVPSDVQHQAMGYDRAATMFAPDGRLLQAEYAEKTVKLGSASIGLVCNDGVVIVADKRVRDKLITQESATKIHEIDDHVIASSAGILSDARILVEGAQVLAQQNRVTYDSAIEPVSIIKYIADKKQMSTQYGGLRPYGVALLVAGVNKGKCYLYTSDVTGNFYGYHANSIGEHDEQIKESLRSDYKAGMSIDDGIKFALKIFKEILDKNFDLERFEVAYIKKDKLKVERINGEDLKKHSK